jgi:hypothetical protein
VYVHTLLLDLLKLLSKCALRTPLSVTGSSTGNSSSSEAPITFPPVLPLPNDMLELNP